MPEQPRADQPTHAAAPAASGITLRAPDFGSPFARMVLTILVLMAGAFLYGRQTLLTQAFGDTDDAMRMVMVRDLLGGQAWFNHDVLRLQPPLGVDMHWSRLVDGTLAGLIALLTPLCGAARAETLVRTAWPLFWLIPAAAAAWSIAHRLGGRRAIGACALLLLLSPAAYLQFAPGRVDHHDLQVVGVLVTLAGAMWMDRSACAGWLAGIATGLLVTVGLEALMFTALIGAAIALRLAADGATAAASRRYAISLGATTALGFLAETDPARWTAPVCDALAVNLLTAVLVAAIGLFWTARRVERGQLTGSSRWIAVVAIGLAAATVYLAVDPSCLRGPFADIDLRLYPIWLDLVREIAPLATIWSDTPPMALVMGFAPAAALLVGGAALAIRRKWRDPAWLLSLSVLALALVLTCAQAIKGSAYAAWIAAPVAAAAVTLIMQRWRALLLPTLMATLALSTPAVLLVHRVFAAPLPEEAGVAACNAPGDFATLAMLPPGLVLADVDLGPMILAFTPHSALSAPYHRMPAGIIAAHAMLNGTPETAEKFVRAREIAYVVLCGPAIAPPFDAVPDSLYRRLKSGGTVPWLKPIASGSALRIFAVTTP